MSPPNPAQGEEDDVDAVPPVVTGCGAGMSRSPENALSRRRLRSWLLRVSSP